VKQIVLQRIDKENEHKNGIYHDQHISVDEANRTLYRRIVVGQSLYPNRIFINHASYSVDEWEGGQTMNIGKWH